jgi:hypothetical protein
MKELKDKATKDLKDAIEKYEAKVQQLSNKIQEQQESLSKLPLPVIAPPQPSPAKPSPVTVPPQPLPVIAPPQP